MPGIGNGFRRIRNGIKRQRNGRRQRKEDSRRVPEREQWVWMKLIMPVELPDLTKKEYKVERVKGNLVMQIAEDVWRGLDARHKKEIEDNSLKHRIGLVFVEKIE